MTETKSITSETSSADHPVHNLFDEIDSLDLLQRLEKLEHENIELAFENNIFERILDRKKNELESTQPAKFVTTNGASQTPTSLNSNNDSMTRADRLARKRSRSRSTQSDIRIQLNWEQKLDIVTTEYEQSKIEKVRCGIDHEKNIDNLKSDIEWIETEILDLESAMADFLRTKEISTDKYTRKLTGEKIDRYFIERIKARDSLTNKLRARSMDFKRQIVYINSQLNEKEELGNMTGEVDFDQLRIENKQYLDIIDVRNRELVVVKHEAGRATSLLNQYKEQMRSDTDKLVSIQQKIEQQHFLHERVKQELQIVSHQQSRHAKKNMSLVEQIERYRVPEIIDYVRRKAQLSNLKRDCDVWQRKVQLVSMALQQCRLQWRTLHRSIHY